MALQHLVSDAVGGGLATEPLSISVSRMLAFCQKNSWLISLFNSHYSWLCLSVWGCSCRHFVARRNSTFSSAYSWYCAEVTSLCCCCYSLESCTSWFGSTGLNGGANDARWWKALVRGSGKSAHLTLQLFWSNNCCYFDPANYCKHHLKAMASFLTFTRRHSVRPDY